MSTTSNLTKTRHSFSIKVVVLGCANVGKTSIIERFVSGNFTGIRRPTIGVDFSSKRVKLSNSEVMIQIWDTAGMERFHNGTLGGSFYRGAHGALLIYDVNNQQSMEQLPLWRDELLSRIEPGEFFPVIIVGNKVDLIVESMPSTILQSDGNLDFDALEKKEETFRTLIETLPVATPVESMSIPLQVAQNAEIEPQKHQQQGWSSSKPDSLSNDSNDASTLSKLRTRKDVLAWCYENGYGHVETSARDGTGVETAMLTIASLAYEAQKSKTWSDSTQGNNVNIHDQYTPPSNNSRYCC